MRCTMKEQSTSEKRALLKRPMGFDEADYYLDNKNALGFNSADKDILENVEMMLSKHRIFSLTDITATVSDGIVTLRGEVPGNEEKKEASFLVQQIEGVKAVINHLQF